MVNESKRPTCGSSGAGAYGRRSLETCGGGRTPSGDVCHQQVVENTILKYMGLRKW